MTGFIMVILMGGLFVPLVLLDGFSGSGHELTAIEDIEMGDYARVAGVIEAPEPNRTVVALHWQRGDWKLVNSTPFHLVDGEDNSVRIMVDPSDCIVFDPEQASVDSWNRTNASFRDGEQVTIEGEVVPDPDHGMVLMALQMDDGMPPSGSGDHFNPFTLIFVGFMIAGVAMAVVPAIILVRRLRLHNDFLMKNPRLVHEKAGLETMSPVMAGVGAPKVPDKNVEWRENPIRRTYVLIGLGSLVAILALISIVGYLAILNMGLFMSGLFIMMVLIFLVIPVIFLTVSRTIADRVGLSQDGLHMGYKRDPPPSKLTTYIPWKDITALRTGSQQASHLLVVETENKSENAIIHSDLHDWIRERYEIHGPHADEAEPILSDEAIESLRDESLRSGRISWQRNPTVFRMYVIGALVSLSGLLGGLFVMMLIGYPPNLSNLNIYVYTIGYPLAFGLPPIVVALMSVSSIVYSENGLHFVYTFRWQKTKKPEFLAWKQIKMVKPAVGGFLNILKRKGEEVNLIRVSPSLQGRIMGEMERRYFLEKGRKGAEPPGTTYARSLENGIRRRLRFFFWSPFLLLTVPVITFTVGLFLEWSLFDLIMVSSLTMTLIPVTVFFLVFRVYFSYRLAPLSVSLASGGMIIEYTARTSRNPAVTREVRWEDIREIKRVSEVLPRYSRGGMLKEKKGSRILILVKKSGASYILGPIDKEIHERIEEMAPVKDG